MSAHALLNLLNELRKEIKCEACRTFYLFYRNEFNKFNNTGARMYVMRVTLFIFIIVSCVSNSRIYDL